MTPEKWIGDDHDTSFAQKRHTSPRRTIRSASNPFMRLEGVLVFRRQLLYRISPGTVLLYRRDERHVRNHHSGALISNHPSKHGERMLRVAVAHPECTFPPTLSRYHPIGA